GRRVRRLLFLARSIPRLPRLALGLRLRFQLLMGLASLWRSSGGHVSFFLSVIQVTRVRNTRNNDLHRRSLDQPFLLQLIEYFFRNALDGFRRVAAFPELDGKECAAFENLKLF